MKIFCTVQKATISSFNVPFSTYCSPSYAYFHLVLKTVFFIEEIAGAKRMIYVSISLDPHGLLFDAMRCITNYRCNTLWEAILRCIINHARTNLVNFIPNILPQTHKFFVCVRLSFSSLLCSSNVSRRSSHLVLPIRA